MASWRNGSASDSRSEGCVFESRRGQFNFCSPIYFLLLDISKCLSLSNFFSFVSIQIEEIKKMKIGDPLDRSTDHGPQNHKYDEILLISLLLPMHLFICLKMNSFGLKCQSICEYINKKQRSIFSLNQLKFILNLVEI